MSRRQISMNEVKIWKALREASTWISNASIHEITGVSRGIIRVKAGRMAERGLLEVIPSYPAQSYRVRKDIAPENEFAISLDLAVEALLPSTQKDQQRYAKEIDHCR